MAKNSSPWQVMSSKGGDEQSANFKYQYHPGGDPNAQPKDAPSALHSVIVPNVNLPKVGATSTFAFGAGSIIRMTDSSGTAREVQ